MNQVQLNQMTVAIIFGGDSPERLISCQSAQAVERALRQLGCHVIQIDQSKSALVEILTSKRHIIDVCFIACHGADGEDGHVQALLDLLEIPYTGSRFDACALAMNKMMSKMVWQTAGLSSPKAQWLNTPDSSLVNVAYPAVIKPINQGSSVGVVKVETPEEVPAGWHEASEYGPVMIESWIQGNELTVAIVGNTPLPVVKIVPSGAFYDYQSKYQTPSTYYCPSGLTKEQTSEIQQIALKAFKAIGGVGWGRVDFIQSHDDGQFYLIEINMIPGMTEKSLVPKAAQEYGWSFNQLVEQIMMQIP